MCTHQREIVNKYTGKKLYVKCGHCPACLQEKAAYRVSRIKAQDHPDLDCLFVCLSYRRNDAPYILRNEAFDFSRGRITKLNIYRDVSYRKVRQNSSYEIGYKKRNDTVVLDTVDFVDYVDFHNLKDLAHVYNHIGICYYPDLQHFVARLRLNLKRNFNFEHDFKTYNCSEYGSVSKRPHFHLLFWIPKGSESTFRSAIIESWPYGDIQRFESQAIQKAYRASSYVASYVNCGSDFPLFLKKYFKPKHSYSKDFGCNNKLFSLDKILEKFSRGHLTYNRLTVGANGNTLVELPFPKYIIHRFFPKFKGYGRVSPSSLCSCMQRIRSIAKGENERFLGPSFYEYELRNDFNKFGDLVYSPLPVSDSIFLNRMASPVYWSDDDIHKIGVRLHNAWLRFNEHLPDGVYFPFDVYCQLHKDIWTCYASDILRLHMQNDEILLNEKYDNLEEIKIQYDEGVRKELPLGFTYSMFHNTDPNKFVYVLRNTGKFTNDFYENVKHRRVNNVILSSVNEEL